MLLYHITDLDSAVKIIQEKRFRPFSNDCYNGDSGLNCFNTLLGGFNYSQSFQNTGVILIFKWSGNIEESHIYFQRSEMKENTLYIQGAWRCFIPVYSKPEYLRAVNIHCNKQTIDNNIKLPIYYNWLPRKCQKKIYRQKKLSFYNYIRELFKEKINIEIR